MGQRDRDYAKDKRNMGTVKGRQTRGKGHEPEPEFSTHEIKCLNHTITGKIYKTVIPIFIILTYRMKKIISKFTLKE